MKTLYLIKRGSRPERHKAPFHPVIMCDLKRIADWEAGSSFEHAWVWMKPYENNCAGWLLRRWNGLDVDYRGYQGNIEMPDGSKACFWRDYYDWPDGIRDLIQGAIWWSVHQLPDWLAGKGVNYPADEFTQQRILDNYADDGCSGFGRNPLPFWPQEEVPAP